MVVNERGGGEEVEGERKRVGSQSEVELDSIISTSILYH